MKRIIIQALKVIMIVFLLPAVGITAEQTEPRVNIDIAGHPYAGLANAPITLVVFSDYL
mgnify:CR=1 FL=1